jgi:hypothetical protein
VTIVSIADITAKASETIGERIGKDSTAAAIIAGGIATSGTTIATSTATIPARGTTMMADAMAITTVAITDHIGVTMDSPIIMDIPPITGIRAPMTMVG